MGIDASEHVFCMDICTCKSLKLCLAVCFEDVPVFRIHARLVNVFGNGVTPRAPSVLFRLGLHAQLTDFFGQQSERRFTKPFDHRLCFPSLRARCIPALCLLHLRLDVNGLFPGLLHRFGQFFEGCCYTDFVHCFEHPIGNPIAF